MAAVSAWLRQQRWKGCWRPRLRCVLPQLPQAALVDTHTHTHTANSLAASLSFYLCHSLKMQLGPAPHVVLKS